MIRRHLKKLLTNFEWLIQSEHEKGDTLYRRIMEKMTQCSRKGTVSFMRCPHSHKTNELCASMYSCTNIDDASPSSHRSLSHLREHSVHPQPHKIISSPGEKVILTGKCVMILR